MIDTQCPSLPGFVDLQVNGYGGTDFSSPDLTIKGLRTVCDTLADRGTTAFLATLITSPIPLYRRNLPFIVEAMQSDALRGRLLGIHLEGPFISGEPGFIGAHNPQYVQRPDPSLLRQMQEWAGGAIRLITLAAELPGAEELSRCARELGMTVSIGHSDCSVADLERLVDAGATALTHLGNALPKGLAKGENPIWAGLANDDLTAMIIADGHHLPDPVAKVMIRAKGIERIAIVSDLCPIAGLPPGEYSCFGSRVRLDGSGRVFDPRRGGLAGSGLTLMETMNRLASFRTLSWQDLLALGFHNPLRLIGGAPTPLRSEAKVGYDGKMGRFFMNKDLGGERHAEDQGGDQ